MDDVKIYSFIDNTIAQIIKDSLIKEEKIIYKEVEIGKQKFILNIWTEIFKEESLITAIEVRKVGVIIDKVYTKGILYKENNIKIISNEKMWELGF